MPNETEAMRDRIMAVHMAKLLADCRARNLRLPYIIAFIDRNGSVSVLRDDGSGNSEMLVDRPEGGGLRLPLNGLLVDQDATAVPFCFDVVHPQGSFVN